MSARSFLLPVTLFFISIAGCDSSAIPDGSGAQATPTAPTASSVEISGSSAIGLRCTDVAVAYPGTSGSYFAVTSGNATVGNTTLWGDGSASAWITRTSETPGTIDLVYYSSTNAVLAERALGVWYPCPG